MELAPNGVRVNTLTPGPIKTPIYNKLGFPADAQKGFEDHMTSQSLFKRFGTADEVTKLVCFLLSDDSSYISGERRWRPVDLITSSHLLPCSLPPPFWPHSRYSSPPKRPTESKHVEPSCLRGCNFSPQLLNRRLTAG